jgi:CRISP-associated protein Cas1
MAEQRVEFVQLDWKGQTTNVGGNSGYSGNSKLIARQLAIKGTKTEVEIAQSLIRQKLMASIKTLKAAIPISEKREFAISRLNEKFRGIQKLPSRQTVSKILRIEGACAAAYFAAWQGLPIRWAGFRQKPIPDNWHFIIPRKMGWRVKTQNARHPVNAMLNYGYGILANKVRTQVIAAGLNPAIGIIHGNSNNDIPLVYDLMEPLRPVVDQAVLDFSMSNTFTPGDFTINKWGGCRLNPQMARVVARTLVNSRQT